MLEWKIHPFLLISPLKTPKHMKLTAKAVVNGSKVYPPLAGLPAVFLARRYCGGLVRRLSCPPSLWRSGGLDGSPAVILADCPADHLMAHIYKREISRFKTCLRFISCFST